MSHGKFVFAPIKEGCRPILGEFVKNILTETLQGAAITSVQAKTDDDGNIPGIEENISEIAENLKKVLVSLKNTETSTGLIIAEEPAEICASNILTNANVEIFNKDVHIATVTAKTSCIIGLTFGTGKGYVPKEESKVNLISGAIPLDCMYAPVMDVKYKVNRIQTGKNKYSDQLVIDVWTNEKLTPDEAMEKASETAHEALSPFTEVLKTAKKQLNEAPEENKTIDSLELSRRTYNCLRRARINTVNDLLGYSESELKRVRCLGVTTYNEIIETLRQKGLSLKE